MSIEEEVALTIMEAGKSIIEDRIRKFKSIVVDIEEFNRELLARRSFISSVLKRTPAFVEKEAGRAFFLLGKRLLFGVEAKKIQAVDDVDIYILRTEPALIPYSHYIALPLLLEKGFIVASWGRTVPVVSNMLVLVDGDPLFAASLLVEEWLASLPLFVVNKYAIMPLDKEILRLNPELNEGNLYITSYGYSTTLVASSDYNIQVDIASIPGLPDRDLKVFSTNLYDAILELTRE